MAQRRDRSRASGSLTRLPNSASTEANVNAVREVVYNFDEARSSNISNPDRADVESSLKLVRDLITIIVSDESNLDKMEKIIEKRASRVSRGETGLSILSTQNRLTQERSRNSVSNEQARLSVQRQNLQIDTENKENFNEEQQKENSQEGKQQDISRDSKTKAIVVNDIAANAINPPVKNQFDGETITEAGTQTSNYELYEELAKRVAETKNNEMSTADLIAKVLPIRDTLKAISEIISDIIENKENLENKDKNKDGQPEETTAVQPIEGVDEPAAEDDMNNLAYYVFYDISEDKRLSAWQRTLDAREKIAEHIIAQTGKRPAEILFNRMSTMELREKQMIQRLMDYADRMNPTQKSARPPSRLRGYVNERSMPVRELQETVTRPRRRDIEISGVPNMVQQEIMGSAAYNCPEVRTQWMNSGVLAQRIREKKRDLKRVVDYYPDISQLSVAGQKKPIQCLSFQEIQKKSREIAEKACANHFNSCFCNPAYGAGTSARRESDRGVYESEARTQ